MEICATTLGETAGDLFAQTLGIGYAVISAVLLAIFGVALGLQLAARRFHPTLYWTVILATSTAGTTMSHYMDRSLGLGCAKSLNAGFVLQVVALFMAATLSLLWGLRGLFVTRPPLQLGRGDREEGIQRRYKNDTELSEQSP